jgi:hypothetical protein
MTPFEFGQKLAADTSATPPAPKPQPLAGPQKFPAPPKANPEAIFKPAPPIYRHPSGAQQVGQITYERPAERPALLPITGRARPFQNAVSQSVVSPGRDSGPGVLRIAQHGGGLGQYNYAQPSPEQNRNQYELSTPGEDAAGNVSTATSIPVGDRAAFLNPAGPPIVPPTRENFPDPEAHYAQERLWQNRRWAAQAAVEKGPALPPDTNPQTIIAKACNNNPNGCTPATYARWLNAERGLNAGYAEQLAKLPRFVDEPPAAVRPASNPPLTLMNKARSFRFKQKPKPALEIKEPAAPTVRSPELPPLNLNKVMMVPPGYLGIGSKHIPLGDELLGDLGSMGAPYLTNALTEGDLPGLPSALHEYRLAKGGDPMREQDWTDTGVYTDARETPLPLVGIHGEAQEFGRHLGLGKELGGGNTTSYLDKIREINANPDATYMQKVRSNWARPVGSALEFGRNMAELTQPKTPIEGFSPIN